MQQVAADKAMSLLDGALFSDEADDISLVARNVRDILLNARKAMSPEKAQEDTRKKRHDPNATLSRATRLPAKEKRKAAAKKRMKK